MKVSKLRVDQGANGLVPAGHYFRKLADELRASNARDAERQQKLDAQDARLEARYRRASAARNNTYAQNATPAPM